MTVVSANLKFVFDELCRPVQQLSVHACYLSQHSLVRLRLIVYFLLAVSHLGLNVLHCADRFQSNIDDIISGSSNHIVHSDCSSSIAR